MNRLSQESQQLQRWEYVKKALKFATRQTHFSGCPMDKKKCRFWNDVFYVCSISRKWKQKIEQKCPCAIEKEDSEVLDGE